MKYVIINGSPRRKNTWKMVNQAKSNLEGDFEEIDLILEQIPMCIGCNNCIIENEYKCPHSDKIQPIIDKIKSSDGIIITSPVYALNVSGLLKNFIDHTAYIYHRPEFFTKKALIVVSTAGSGHKGVAKYIDETLRHWGVNKTYKITYRCGGKDSIDVEAIDKISKRFNDDVKSGKLHNPKFSDIIFYNVWRAMAASDSPLKSDRDYWIKTDLINNDFAPEVKLNIVKKAFSKVMFFILKKVL